jgi:hypothetical protein
MAQSVEDGIRACRIVIGGLIGGLVMFGAVAMLVAPVSPSPDPTVTAALFGALALMGMGCAMGYAAVRRAMLNELRARGSELTRESDPASVIMDRYRAFVTVGGGLIEGPGFLALVTYIVSGSVAALAAAGVAVLLLILHLPSAERVRRLAEDASQRRL